jgi:hypothetical protein
MRITMWVILIIIILLVTVVDCSSPIVTSESNTSTFTATTTPNKPIPTSANSTSIVARDAQPQASVVTPTTISPEMARSKAFEYVSTTYGISVDELKVYEQTTMAEDIITKEKVEYLAIGDTQVAFAKLIVDTSGKVWDAVQYDAMINERYKNIAGNLNPGLYNYLQGKESNDLINVMIVVDLNNNLTSNIESRGFKITKLGDTKDSRFIYAELPKWFILELAKNNGTYIEQDIPYQTD